MGKINLRNRIRDNADDNQPQSQPANNQFGNNNPINQPTPNFNQDQTLRQPAFATQQPAPVEQPVYNNMQANPVRPPMQQPPQTENYYQAQPSFEQRAPQAEPQYMPPQQNYQQPRYEQQQEEKKNFRKRGSGLFKEVEEEPSKGFTGLLKGTKKLFNKKLDALPAGPKNLLDKLNVNKRMLYIALGTSAVAAILVLNYLNSLTKSKIYGSNIINVLVSTKEIKERGILSMDNIRVAEIPERYMSPYAIKITAPEDIKKYVGRAVVIDVGQGEQLTEKRVVTESNAPWKSPFIPANHRAFDIPTKNMSYIKPGEKVDLLISVPHPIDKRKIINTPVLQNASVLAVDGKFKVSNNETTPGDSVMVAVPNKLVHLFSLLQERGGNFKVILKNEGDTTPLSEQVSIEKLELMFADTANKIDNIKVEKLKVEAPKPKPVFVEPPPQVYNPPAPAYVPPAYNPPAPKYNPPKPKAEKPKPQAEAPKSTHTVTVINGTNVHQDKVEKKEEKKEENK
ncbi:MAG: Flp pilus assembly protein CpaB [Candidatus Sericytochromatia bacterium]